MAYYSDFLKRDDQVLATRLQHEERLNARKKHAVDVDRARAYGGQDGAQYGDADQDLDDDVAMDDVSGDNYGSKTIVIHIGSQNLRLGLATDALPRTVPMVIARKATRSEAEDSEPKPKRLKFDENAPSEEWFGEEVCCALRSLTSLLTQHSSQKSTTPWLASSRYPGDRTNAEFCPTLESW